MAANFLNILRLDVCGYDGNFQNCTAIYQTYSKLAFLNDAL